MALTQRTVRSGALHGADRVVTAVALALLVGGCGQSTLLVLNTEQDPEAESTFTLDFGSVAGKTRASVANTRFKLELDRAAGTARQLSYSQRVAPLTLPGGFSTGNIRVEVVPDSSSGTYDASTGELITSESYAIYFEGDLSAFGLTSPVILPSTSRAKIDFLTSRTGRVSLHWSGQGELPDPVNPEGFILFDYSCDVEASFVVEPSLLSFFEPAR